MEGGIIIATMICLCGMPGSGKTTWAKYFLRKHPDYLYFSPDEYHERINGDECDRTNIFEVWHSMFRDIHIAETDGHNVLIDSDNLTYAQRMQWIEWFPGFDRRELICFDAELEDCIQRVNQRRRKIPFHTMVAKFENFENPMYNKDVEFWNTIILHTKTEKENKNEGLSIK